MPARKRLLHHVPPTAVPVTGGDLWRGLTALLAQQRAPDRFRSALMQRTASPHCYLVSSGRAALTLILLGLKRLSGRRTVVVPAYACPTVVQSVLKAGLEPVMCDVSPQTLGLDRAALERLINHDVLAVVPAHLYGWAQDVRDLISIGQESGFYVVEDAAQAFGAALCGRLVGTWGDAGFYSLGRGKCVPVGHGGVIVSQERCAPAISEAIRDSATETARWDVVSLAMFAGYGLVTNPIGWWFAVRTPLNPAQEGMDINTLHPIRLGRLSAVQAGIGASILGRLGETEDGRRENARRLLTLLGEFDFVTLPEIAPVAEPVFLRLPFVVEGEELANRLFDMLSGEGIGISRSYWRTLPDLFSGVVSSDGQEFPGASSLASRLLTLPTHAYLGDEDFARIASVFHAANSQGG